MDVDLIESASNINTKLTLASVVFSISPTRTVPMNVFLVSTGITETRPFSRSSARIYKNKRLYNSSKMLRISTEKKR